MSTSYTLSNVRASLEHRLPIAKNEFAMQGPVVRLQNWVACPVCTCTDMQCASNLGTVDDECMRIDGPAFAKLHERHPERSAVLERFAAVIALLRHAQANSPYPVVLLSSEFEAWVAPVQEFVLAQTLGSLVNAQVLATYLECHGQKYHSVSEVPSMVIDPHTGEDTAVLLEDLHLFFHLRSAP